MTNRRAPARRTDLQPEAAADEPRQAYLVNIGFDYPPEKRAEPGDIVDDIPQGSLWWMLRDGVITPVARRAEDQPADEPAPPALLGTPEEAPRVYEAPEWLNEPLEGGG